MSAISLVSIQKPARHKNPILQRRNRFTTSLDQQINKLGLFAEGKRISRENFWTEGNFIYLQLKYGKQNVEMKRGQSVLKAENISALISMLDEVKAVAIAGGLDDALAACAQSVRQNFKAAKDKKSGKN